ncbi:MAG TPA: hypothetical protein VN674_03860 [Gemmatimonadales bacterium]|nr:hypothetical protein [Gemmatimonadales bacterium]
MLILACAILVGASLLVWVALHPGSWLAFVLVVVSSAILVTVTRSFFTAKAFFTNEARSS